MNGSRFLLDTNALIALDSNAELRQNLKNATWIGTSIICITEYLSFDKLPSEQKNSFLASASTNDAVILTRDKQLLNNPNFKSQHY